MKVVIYIEQDGMKGVIYREKDGMKGVIYRARRYERGYKKHDGI